MTLTPGQTPDNCKPACHTNTSTVALFTAALFTLPGKGSCPVVHPYTNNGNLVYPLISKN